MIWKERNKRIFKDRSSPLEIIWGNFCHNLQETLAIGKWTQEDLPSIDAKKAIWENWNLNLQLDAHSPTMMMSSNSRKVSWTPPPKNSINLNFDGASKGNPINVGFGVVIRDYKGSPILIYFGKIGWDTNNLTELEGLWQGLLLSKNFNLQPLEIEGDSQILINMAKQLQNGTHARKVANSWRREARLEAIEHLLHNNEAIIFNHIRREGNKVADLLANLGVEARHTMLSSTTDIIQNHDHAQEFTKLVQSDAAPPDAGE